MTASIRFSGDRPPSASSGRIVRRRRRRLRHARLEAELNRIYQTAPIGLAVLDSELRFVRVNERVAAINGRAIDEHIGQHLHDILPPPLATEVETVCRGVIDSGIAQLDIELRAEMPSQPGVERAWLASYHPVTAEDGTVLGVGAVVREITGRRQAEESLRAAHEQLRYHAGELEERVRERTAQLEATNQELEAFVHSVSHDLRAPLRVIDGFSAALVEEYAGVLDNQGAHYVRRMREGVERMQQLLDALLGLARVSRADVRREPVDLSAMAYAVAADLRQAEPRRRVEVAIAAGLDAVGDPRLLRLVLENLLGNAWKYTSRHARARVELGRMPSPDDDGERGDVAAAGAASSTVYFVRDDGAGFDMASAARLFGAFQRLHSRDEFEGNGIGLATVQRIVRLHGGRIWAEGAVEQGATFYFTLG